MKICTIYLEPYLYFWPWLFQCTCKAIFYLRTNKIYCKTILFKFGQQPKINKKINRCIKVKAKNINALTKKNLFVNNIDLDSVLQIDVCRPLGYMRWVCNLRRSVELPSCLSVCLSLYIFVCLYVSGSLLCPFLTCMLLEQLCLNWRFRKTRVLRFVCFLHINVIYLC